MDFSPCDDFTANEAITFLIRVPFPKLIESSQDVEFFFIRQVDQTTERHGNNMLFDLLPRNPAIAGLTHQLKSKARVYPEIGLEKRSRVLKGVA